MYQKKKEERLVKESEYPYDVFCPMCKTKSVITSQENRTVECWRCGLSYDRKNKVWIDMRTNRPFGEKRNRVIGTSKFGFFEP